jgi:F0F1-type ATP synthase delta subunit
MPTRTSVAEFVASQLVHDRKDVLAGAAAWLVATKRVRQADYFVNDIAKYLQQQGYLFARVTSAYELSDSTKKEIMDYLCEMGPKQVEVEYELDPALLGGIRIETPTAMLDATIRMKLDRLVEGLQ